MITDNPFHFANVEPSFSVIIPFFNEGENVARVCQELELVLRSMSPGGEVILIDDGSTDGTAEVMDRLAESWPHCHVHHQALNQGQAAALLAGFSAAKAPLIVTMDGDGQNDPRDIPRLLARLPEADMVVGIRTGRQDSWARRIISWLANLVRARWLGDGVSDAGCAIKAFRREVIGAFIPIRTLYSFMPALAVAAGFQVVEEPVNHRARQHGHSSYTVRSFLFWPIVDFIGLGWFTSRRCRPSLPRSERATSESTFTSSIKVAFCLFLIALVVLLATLSREKVTRPAVPKVSRARAGQIALHEARRASLGTHVLRQKAGRHEWHIKLPHSSDLDEVRVDAINGHVVGIRNESAEEARFEMAAEERAAKVTPPSPPF